MKPHNLGRRSYREIIDQIRGLFPGATPRITDKREGRASLSAGLYVVCAKCGHEDKTEHGHSGTRTIMRCEDCAGTDGRATLCRDCCPTSHGTHS